MGDILHVTVFVMCKTEPPCCFCCTIDVFWVALFSHNRSKVKQSEKKCGMFGGEGVYFPMLEGRRPYSPIQEELFTQ